MKQLGRLGGLAAIAVTLGAVLPVTGCSFVEKATETSDGSGNPTSGPSVETSATSSASPTPTESQSEVDNQPDTVPDGDPVTPDIFMVTVDPEGGVLRVVILVPGIYEDDGLCTVTVVGVSATISKDGTSVADASATVCGEFTFGLADLGSGTARITATYESDDHEGSSVTTEVSIP